MGTDMTHDYRLATEDEDYTPWWEEEDDEEEDENYQEEEDNYAFPNHWEE